MRSDTEVKQVAAELLASKNLCLVSCRPIQTLWAGYGHICQVKAILGNSSRPEGNRSLILKHVSPPQTTNPKESTLPDEGHIRKILSYQIEQYFYAHLAPQMPSDIAVASCHASINPSSNGGNAIAMLLTDLRGSFPIAGEKRAKLSETQVYASLAWLAGFHGFWWGRADEVRRIARVEPPLEHFARLGSTILSEDSGVWANGGYTYLATRRKEYDELQDDMDTEWSSALCSTVGPGGSSVAELAAAFLSSAAAQVYQTLIHGDVKSENLFTTAKEDAVAFFDFQYIGLGLGVCDLAKLFTCSVPLGMLVDDEGFRLSKLEMQGGEERLLRAYHEQVQRRSGKVYDWALFTRHWETALVDWLRFQASWGLWGNSEWLEARVRCILSGKQWLRWLQDTLHE